MLTLKSMNRASHIYVSFAITSDSEMKQDLDNIAAECSNGED